MKKILFSFLFTALVFSVFESSSLNAQSLFTYSLFGVKGGVNLATMSYDAKEYKVYEPSYLLGPQFGIFMESNISRSFSFRPEFLVIQRGAVIDNFQGVDYQMSAYYLDLRIPFLYNIRGVKGFIPYFILSPNFGTPFAGKVVRNGLEENLKADHIDDIDFGLCC